MQTGQKGLNVARRSGCRFSYSKPPNKCWKICRVYHQKSGNSEIVGSKVKTKVLALLVAVLMALSMVAAFAENPTYTITVNSSDNHTYRVYQVLTGTLSDANSKKLGNPAWGADAKDSTADVNDFIESINATGLDRDDIAALVTAAVNTNGEGQGTVDKEHPKTVTPGYYVLVDETAEANLADGETLSLNIVEVVRNVTVTAKNGTTTSDKKVDDVNDSTGASQTGQESADYDIGDHIPYTLSATLPANYADYTKYYLQFQDDMSEGLTLDTGSVKIYYGDSDTTGASISFTAAEGTSYTGGQLYTYTIADVKTTASALSAGDKIYIKYTATLNDKAVINDKGNPNKSRIVFSKNPNWDGTGTPDTGDTPWDIAVVFTYKTVFNKIDKETKKPLTGADFRLDKFIKDENGSDTYKTVKGTWTDVTTLGDSKHPSKNVDTYTKDTDSAANAKFTFAGLDDGYYRLVETATPEGYNTLEDTYFEITANHTVTGLESLAGTDGAQFNMLATKAEGKLEADIENGQGTQLPSTGGIGTTIFYIAGSLLAIGAAILLITKRRMGSDE